MTTELRPVPKPEPRTEADRLTRRIASLKKLRASQKPIPRSPKPIPGGPRRKAVKKRNAKRKASEFARAYGSRERVAWVKRQRCIVTGLHSSTVENVHVRGGGGSRKADACWIVPMVAHKHRELHETGKRTFEAKHSIDLDAAAEYTEKRWQRHVEVECAF